MSNANSQQRLESEKVNKDFEGKIKAVFDINRDQYLVDLCIEHNTLSNTLSAASKKQAWNRVKDKFNKKFGTNYIKSQFQDHLLYLKRIYQFVKDVKDLSGFGWNPIEHRVTAPQSVWDDYFQRHPEKKKYRDKRVPSFDSLARLFDGVVATGAQAESITDNIINNVNKDTQFTQQMDKATSFISLDQIEENVEDAPSSPDILINESIREKRSVETRSTSRKRKKMSAADSISSEIREWKEVTKQLFTEEKEEHLTLFEKATKIIMSITELTSEQKVKAICLIKGEREAGIFCQMTLECQLIYLKELGLVLDF